jgi:hypothetical protein
MLERKTRAKKARRDREAMSLHMAGCLKIESEAILGVRTRQTMRRVGQEDSETEDETRLAGRVPDAVQRAITTDPSPAQCSQPFSLNRTAVDQVQA